MTKQEFLAMILPHELFGICCNKNKNIIVYVTAVSPSSVMTRPFSWVEHKYFKPILHPLSDINKEIEHKGERFVPIERIYDNMGWEKEEIKKIIDEDAIEEMFEDNDLVPFSHALMLISWHFAIGLNKDDYIDVNTLKDNPYK